MASRTPFLVALALLGALAAATWLLLRPAESDYEVPPEVVREPGEAAPATDESVTAPPPEPLAGRADPHAGPRTAPPGPRHPIIHPDEIPRGGLVVTPVTPDGEPYPPGAIDVSLHGVPRPYWSAPRGIPDYETGAWTFSKVPVGSARLEITGDHVVTTTEMVEIEADEVPEIRVPADRAGSIHYVARSTRGEEARPERVTLTLYDERTKLPMVVHYQERAADALSAPRRVAEITQGPEGVIFGVPAGPYVLKGTSPGGDVHEVPVTVRLGETSEVVLEFLR